MPGPEEIKRLQMNEPTPKLVEELKKQKAFANTLEDDIKALEKHGETHIDHTGQQSSKEPIPAAPYSRHGEAVRAAARAADVDEPDQLDLIEQDFIRAFNRYAEYILAWAHSKGWDAENANMGELIALMHSELSEALEADRHGNPPDDKIPEYTGVAAEFADTIIRLMHVAAARNIPLGQAIVAKMKYNETRSHKHGGKKY